MALYVYICFLTFHRLHRLNILIGGKHYEGLCGRNKFISVMTGKLHSSKSGGLKVFFAYLESDGCYTAAIPWFLSFIFIHSSFCSGWVIFPPFFKTIEKCEKMNRKHTIHSGILKWWRKIKTLNQRFKLKLLTFGVTQQ